MGERGMGWYGLKTRTKSLKNDKDHFQAYRCRRKQKSSSAIIQGQEEYQCTKGGFLDQGGGLKLREGGLMLRKVGYKYSHLYAESISA